MHAWRQLPKFDAESATISQEVDGEMSTLTILLHSKLTINISFRIIKMVRISLVKNMLKIAMMDFKLWIIQCENKTILRIKFIDEKLLF